MMLRWYRSRRNLFIISIIAVLCLLYYVLVQDSIPREDNLDVTRSTGDGISLATLAPVVPKITLFAKSPRAHDSRVNIIEFIEMKLEEALMEDKGTGCEFTSAHLNPFNPEMTQFDKEPPSIHCTGEDWVKCYQSECRVKQSLLKQFKYIDCDYKDIIYHSDNKYTLGDATTVHGSGAYTLNRSDHVKITCVGQRLDEFLSKKWLGHGVGFRKNVQRVSPPPGREDSIDVLIFGFDSTSRNTFIRRLPKSWEFLTKNMGATVLYGYNIVGDGTPAALFPILTGKTELELPDVRKKSVGKGSLDDMPFIFYKLKEDGYRTAYFEDMPWIGTFQYRFKGFKKQPADHYLRAFYLEESRNGKKWNALRTKYCVGDTPQFKMMMNITEQFLNLDGKHYIFTFIADITHDDYNTIALADTDTRNFLQSLLDSGKLEKTLLIMMSDHGPRFAKTRDTLQGKFEERQPLMSIRIPEVLKRRRPEIEAILKNNSHVLTTPHDIYATVLDAMGMEQYWNDYKIKGADLTRGLTLFEPVPKNRSCSEAGVEAHWCACVNWDPVPLTDPLTSRVALAFVDFINELTKSVRSSCAPRSLSSVAGLLRRRESPRMLQFQHNRDADGYLGQFDDTYRPDKVHYQIKLQVGPGVGIYEASTTYLKKEDKFIFDTRDISRINRYNDEPSCISATHPHLNMYCYCHKF